MVLLLIGLSLGGLILLGAGAYLLHNYGDLFSYNGLRSSDIQVVRKRLAKYYDLLSSVAGRDWLTGDSFTRGIYVPKAGGMPLYYRYTVKRDGNRSFNLYPMVYEMWSTNSNILGNKTRMIR